MNNFEDKHRYACISYFYNNDSRYLLRWVSLMYNTKYIGSIKDTLNAYRNKLTGQAIIIVILSLIVKELNYELPNY